MPEKTLPDQIADFFIALIFIETLKPGDKLPPERYLAELLQVDRTSLRTALKIVIRMNLLKSVQGSGITVLDMRTHAGIDTLDKVLQIPEIKLGSELLIHTVESSLQLLPAMFTHTLKSFNEAARKNMVSLFQDQVNRCKQGASGAELALFDIEIQDVATRFLDQPLAFMTANSSRRLRIMLFTILYEQVDLQGHFEKQLAMVQEVIEGTITIDELEQRYRQHIKRLGDGLIQQLQKLPKKSFIEKSPIKHIPDRLSIFESST